LALILGLILVGISPWVAPSFASRALLPIVAIQLLIDALAFDWYLQGVGRHSIVAASRFLGQIAYAVVLLPLLAGGLAGARHYALANLAGLGVAAAIMLLFVVRDAGPSVGKIGLGPIRQRVTRSAPFLWWIALTQIYYSTDLILVAVLAGDRKAGLYAAASKLPIAVTGVAALWFSVSMPETARLHSTAQTDVIRRQSRVATTTAIVAGLPFVLLGPIFATGIAITLFGPKFAGSGPALAILLVSVAVSLLQIVVTSVVIGAGRERPYVRAMSAGAAMNVALNLVLIPRLGIVGAAISTLVSETLVLLAGITQMMHVTGHIEVRWRAIRQAGATAAVAGSLALLLRQEAGFVAGVLGATVVYAAVIAFRTARNPGWLNAWLGGA
jgi:O-antigen/teichoic acid export membrane protein